MHIVLVDSRDSFVHNLEQAFLLAGSTVEIVQSAELSACELHNSSADLVVLGPGPGRPEDAGCLVALVKELSGSVPLFGVCLGMQAIALAYGGTIEQHAVVHGRATAVHHDGEGCFKGLNNPAWMTRYHSLVVCAEKVPASLTVTASSDDGAIMGLRHTSLPVYGVQFHPESILSAGPGAQLLANAVAMAEEFKLTRPDSISYQQPPCVPFGPQYR